MFSFSQMLLIAVVALLVVGPKRLPEVLRSVARWSRTIRRTITDVRWQIERELDFDLEGKKPPNRIYSIHHQAQQAQQERLAAQAQNQPDAESAVGEGQDGGASPDGSAQTHDAAQPGASDSQGVSASAIADPAVADSSAGSSDFAQHGNHSVPPQNPQQPVKHSETG